MLRIQCPFCGERDYTEFRYGGDARRKRPAHGSTDQKAWYSYVFLFDNPKGLHQEFWQHLLGCRQWLVLERSTETNQTATSLAARDFARMREATALGEAVTK